MKRRVAIILLLLVAGAIVNIAVAWGCGVRIDRMTTESPQALSSSELDLLWEQYAMPETKRTLNGWRETNIATTVRWFGNNLPVYGAFQMGGASMDILLVDSGFPIRIARRMDRNALFYLGTVERAPTGLEWFLRVKPYWPGFAINTLFYAGILWLLFAAPVALRRRRRIKRGLCPACAYPVGESEVCTECGKAVISARSGA
jgi:hypothetical protein